MPTECMTRPMTPALWPQDVLSTLRVQLGTGNTRFSAALSTGTGQISVTGTVKGTHPYLVRIGAIDVDLLMEGIVMLVRQVSILSYKQPSADASMPLRMTSYVLA